MEFWSERPKLIGEIGQRLRLPVHWLQRAPGSLLLALCGEPLPHAAIQHVCQSQPYRHGDLLQSGQKRDPSVHSDRGKPLWVLAGDHRQVGQKSYPNLRSRRLLTWKHLCRGERYQLEGRGKGHLVYFAILSEWSDEW